MFKGLLNMKTETTKIDVVMAIMAVGVAVWKAVETITDYKNGSSECES